MRIYSHMALAPHVLLLDVINTCVMTIWN